MSGHNDPIAELVQRYAEGHLRSYKGNLDFAVRVIHKELLPIESDPAVLQHLETLRNYLAGIGQPENDSFLLRLGLTVPGMQRGIQPPLVVLEPNRGGFSQRRQKEAGGQILRLREALTIARRFFPHLNTNTQPAIEELASALLGRAAPIDSDWLRWFDALSAQQAEQLAEFALQYLDSQEKPIVEIGIDILKHLATFRWEPMSERCCRALIERRIFWPPSLYRASEAVAGNLISLIDGNVDQLRLNHLLLSLAWTRSAAASESFRGWEARAPTWTSKLHVAPKEYLHSAGWCLDEDGQRRDLISTTCYRLPLVEALAPQSLRCRVPIEQNCPSCGGPLSWLFDFSETGEKFFVGEFASAPRRILCCLHCSCAFPVYATYRGQESWHPGNQTSKYPYSGNPDVCIRRIDELPSPPIASAEAFALDDASSLGGLPMWLQDAEYPPCIECKRPMVFLAQHDNSPLREEGIYYAFFCDRCQIAAVNYQQT